MKTKILYQFIIIIALAGIMYACNKSSSTPAAGVSTTDLQTQSDDQSRVSSESDAVANDVNLTMSSQSSVSGSSAAPAPGYGSGVAIQGVQGVDTVSSVICDATITIDTSSSIRKITITYNGSNCAGTRTRKGVVVISIPAGVRWRDSGAVVTFSIQNLKITRLSDNKSITLNGTHTYTNVSGGSMINLPARPNGITHTITSDNMSVTFDDASQRTWHVARKHVYTYNNGIVITTTGIHTEGGTTGISEWGTNRFGNNFLTAISMPLIIRQDCSFRLTSGQVAVVRPEVTTTVTFGLDATGAATSCPVTGSYYFKVIWTTGGKSYTYILPY